MEILIVKLGALGDLSFARPAIPYLRQALPEANIEWLVSEELADFLRADLGPQAVKTLSGRDLYRGSAFTKMRTSLKTRSSLSASYDLILLFHRDPQFLPLFLGKGPLAWPVRKMPRWSPPGLKPVLCEPLILHESLALKRVTDQGLRWVQPEIQLPPDSAWGAVTRAPSEKETQTLGVHLGGGQNVGRDYQLKRWPYMPELLRLILSKTNLRVRLVGSKEEEPDARKILGSLESEFGERIEDLVGQTSVATLRSAIAGCDLFFGPDSGPLHIADALAIPSLGVFGPTSPVSWGLRGPQSQSLFVEDLACRPCYRDDGNFPPCYNQHRCMTDLSAEKIFEEIETLRSLA